MMSTRCILVGLGALAAGCGSSGSSADADDGTYNCDVETRADTFTVGLEKPGTANALDFKLMTATPAPPARGDNKWVIQVNVMSGGVVGAPLTGAGMTITPFMPDHQHGTPIHVNVTEMTTAGQYELYPVNLWMPGLWQTTIDVNQGAAKDQVVYSFCLPN